MNAKDAMIESVIEAEHRILLLQDLVSNQAALIQCYERQAKEYAEFVTMLKEMLARKNTA